MTDIVSPIEHISDTALWVAYFRAIESERRDALFHDPYARILAGERGEMIAHNMRNGMAGAWAMIARTKSFDELILQTIRNQHCDAVLNLAAGLDSRPYRLELPASLRWIEVDLPDILDYKAEKLAGEHPACLLESVGLDLKDRDARNAFFNEVNGQAKNVLVVTEGLTLYLTAEQVASLADDLHAQSGFRWWLTEFISPQLLEYLQSSWNDQLSAGGASAQFSVEDNEGFYRQHGWNLAEYRSAMEESHRLKREMPLAWLWRFLGRFMPKERMQSYRMMSGYALLAKDN